MIEIKEAVIVEGKYDKMRLKGILNSVIVETGGFRLFKDNEKLSLIKNLAEKQGIVILTDSDSAGFVIRNHLKSAVSPDKIKNAYIPTIQGKEKRKSKPSKEGLLGVEGIDEKELLLSLQRAGATIENSAETSDNNSKPKISKSDLYKLGLSGHDNSSILRKKLLKHLNLPEYITANALCELLSSLYDFEKLKEKVDTIKSDLSSEQKP
ncbi:MAG: DUF4093 domain-containing protein [Clostridia bacterium]|nr:DUF4093 domain-containing protein [Clostridia bacterium]